MPNILKHTGSNIGGVNPFEYVFTQDVATLTIDPLTLICTITLKTGKLWNYIYGTPDSIQIESKEEDTPAGMKYSYQIKMLVPQDRASVQAILKSLDNRLLIIKALDKNGVIRLFGDLQTPMRKTSKLLKPPTLEGYNGFEVQFNGEFSTPAAYISNSLEVPFPSPTE